MSRHQLLILVLIICLIGLYFVSKSAFLHQSKGSVPAGDSPRSMKLTDQKPSPKSDQFEQKVLAGFIQDYRNPEQIDYDKFTHIIFSFAHPTSEGDLILNGEQARKNLKRIVKLTDQHDTKVIIAVGGWYHIQGGRSYDHFQKAISNPDSRQRLAAELSKLVHDEKLDGVDIDFEHPKSKADARDLSAFAKELNHYLKPTKKELSVSVNAKVHSVTGSEIHSIVFDPEMFKYVDHVNLMAYDGQWDGGYDAANLAPYPFTRNVVDYWTSLFDEKGFSRGKLVLGVPLYGQPEDPAAKQVSYDILAKNNPENLVRDSVKINGHTYHYNSHPTLRRKTQLALEQDLGGMMMWEAGLDSHGPDSAAIVINDVLKDPKYAYRK